jgi:hypothetical protein
MAPVRFESATLRGPLRRALEDLDRAFEAYKRRLRRKMVTVAPTPARATSPTTGERQRQSWVAVMFAGVSRVVSKILNWLRRVLLRW